MLVFSIIFQYLQIPLLHAAQFINSESIPEIKNTRLVALLVEDSLLKNGSLKEKIYQYAEDVQKRIGAQGILVPISKEISPLEIYEGLAQLYFSGEANDGKSQLIGTVLIGDIPLPVVEKDGNFWPTIFPYTDFKNPIYRWDFKKDRFIVAKYGDNEPEIWHGVIRSTKTSLDQQITELETFFDNNHRVHLGEETYSKKLFYADFFRQKNVLPELLFFKYNQWLKYVEELQYLRYSKHLAKQLRTDQDERGSTLSISNNLTESEKVAIAESAAEQNSSVSVEDVLASMNTDSMDLIPDVQSKFLIDNFVNRYFETYKSWLTLLNQRVSKSGRWKANEIDTTPSLVSRKDEASLLVLKSYNDAIEERFIKHITEEQNIQSSILVPKNTFVCRSIDEDSNECDSYILKELYWNGVDRSDLNVMDCSIYRGKRRTEDYPFSQQVEANRTFNIETVESCAHPSEMISIRESDVYEGCCAKNLKFSDNTFSYNVCEPTTSYWNDVFVYGNGKYLHVGPELPVFDITGTIEKDGPYGAYGCNDIMVEDFNFRGVFTDGVTPVLESDPLGIMVMLDEEGLPIAYPEDLVNQNVDITTRFQIVPSLVVHNEPTVETIQEQVAAGFSVSMPMDAPRGFSFYDAGGIFRKGFFTNIFDYRETALSEVALKSSVETAIIDSVDNVNNSIKEGNIIAMGKLMSDLNNVTFDISRTRVERIAESTDLARLDITTSFNEATIDIQEAILNAKNLVDKDIETGDVTEEFIAAKTETINKLDASELLINEAIEVQKESISQEIVDTKIEFLNEVEGEKDNFLQESTVQNGRFTSIILDTENPESTKVKIESEFQVIQDIKEDFDDSLGVAVEVYFQELKEHLPLMNTNLGVLNGSLNEILQTESQNFKVKLDEVNVNGHNVVFESTNDDLSVIFRNLNSSFKNTLNILNDALKVDLDETNINLNILLNEMRGSLNGTLNAIISTLNLNLTGIIYDLNLSLIEQTDGLERMLDESDFVFEKRFLSYLNESVLTFLQGIFESAISRVDAGSSIEEKEVLIDALEVQVEKINNFLILKSSLEDLSLTETAEVVEIIEQIETLGAHLSNLRVKVLEIKYLNTAENEDLRELTITELENTVSVLNDDLSTLILVLKNEIEALIVALHNSLNTGILAHYSDMDEVGIVNQKQNVSQLISTSEQTISEEINDGNDLLDEEIDSIKTQVNLEIDSIDLIITAINENILVYESCVACRPQALANIEDLLFSLYGNTNSKKVDLFYDLDSGELELHQSNDDLQETLELHFDQSLVNFNTGLDVVETDLHLRLENAKQDFNSRLETDGRVSLSNRLDKGLTDLIAQLTSGDEDLGIQINTSLEDLLGLLQDQLYFHYLNFVSKFDEINEIQTIIDNWNGGFGDGYDYLELDVYLSGPKELIFFMEWQKESVESENRKSKSNYYNLAEFIDSSLLIKSSDNFDFSEIKEALDWIDKDIEEKNRIVFETAFSEKENVKDFFFDDLSDGYELIEIIAEGDKKKGIKMAFLPTSLMVDKEFADAKKRFSGFSFEQDSYQFQFLGENLGDTFLEREEEETCDKLSGSMETWPEFLACVLSKTLAGKTTDVNMPGLGKKEAGSPIIENKEVDLIDSVLSIEPKEIFISNYNTDLINVKVVLKNSAGEIQTDNFSTRVQLVFSSSDASRFFKISPAQTIPFTAGEANFLLIPQTDKFGGALELFAQIEGEENFSLVSKSIPIKITNFAIDGYSEKKEITVNDNKGVLIKARIKNNTGNLSSKFEGTKVQFISEEGSFMGGEDIVEIEDGVAKALFFPGKKAGLAKITIIDLEKNIPSDEVFLEILPDSPATIKIQKKSNFLIEGVFDDISAIITDEFGNSIENISHKFSWEYENLNVEAESERDQDPQEEGIQEFIYKGKSLLKVVAEKKVNTAQIGVSSDLFESGFGIVRNFEIIKNPIFEISAKKNSIVAGEANSIEIFITAKTKSGDLISDDFLVYISSNLGHFPKSLLLKDGIGSFKFFPGIVANTANIMVSSVGFETKEFEINILPDEPKKINFSVSEEIYSSQGDDPVLIDIMVVDRFGNLTKRFEENIEVTITNDTKHLLEITSASTLNGGSQMLSSQEIETGGLLSNISLENGKTTVTVVPKGLSGMAHLIVDNSSLVGDTLEIEFTDFFTPEDVKSLTPKSLFALILGFEAGDLLAENNFALNFLFAGKTQSVGTLITDPNPFFQFGSISPTGEFYGKLKTKFNFKNFPEVFFQYKDENLLQSRILFSKSPEIFIDETEIEDAGIYFIPEKFLASDIAFEDRVIYYKELPLFEISKQGGIELKDSLIVFEQAKDFKNILQWNILKDDKLLGVLRFNPEEESLIAKDSLFAENYSGISIKKISPDILFDDNFIENSTNKRRGISFFDRTRKESKNGKLGSPKSSAENALDTEEVTWDFNWKPGTIFGAKNTIGDSAKFGASDIFILFGDPTLSVQTENENVSLGIKKDIGKPIWKAPFGVIDQILSMDINGDGQKDILIRIENELVALYQEKGTSMNFRDVGNIFNFNGGVRQLEILNKNIKNEVSNTTLNGLLQLTFDGKFVLFENKNGVFFEKMIPFEHSLPITNFHTAILNDDIYQDLVFLDEDNSLWLLFGEADGFSPNPVFLQNFSPKFDSVDEVFDGTITETSEGFLKYLNSTLINFEGMNDFDQKALKFSIPNDDSQNAEIEIDDIESAIWGDLESLKNLEKDFLPVTNHTFLDASYSMVSQNQNVKLGDEITVVFTFKSNEKLENFEFMPPTDPRLKLKENSFTCLGCIQTPAFRSQHPFGEFWAFDFDVPARTTVTFSWKLVVKETPQIQFFVGDFEDGRDNLSDIVIPWEIDGKRKLIKFLSSQKLSSYQRKNWLVSTNPVVLSPDEAVKEAQDIYEIAKKYKSIYPIPKVVDAQSDSNVAIKMKDFLSVENQQEMFKDLLVQDSDMDGFPDSYDTYPQTKDISSLGAVETIMAGLLFSVIGESLYELENKKLSFFCGGGDCFNFPVSIAFFAPGLASLYIPPITIPIGFSFGFPILQWLTTLWVGPIPVPSMWPISPLGLAGVDNPTLGFGGIYPSSGRIYLMPTTTGKVGIAFCMGLYGTSMIPPLWLPNCFVAIPPIDAFMGFCPKEAESDNSLLGAATAIALTNSGGIFNVSPRGKVGMTLGAFTAKVEATDNIQIPGVDIIATWWQEQERAFSKGLQLPTLSFIGPNLDSLEVTEPAEETPQGGALEKLSAEASKYPFIDLKTAKVSIPIPNISIAELDQLDLEMEEWMAELKGSIDLSLPDLTALKASIEKIKTKIENLTLSLDAFYKLPDYIALLDAYHKLKGYITSIEAKIKKLKEDYQKNCKVDLSEVRKISVPKNIELDTKYKINDSNEKDSCSFALEGMLESEAFLASLNSLYNQISDFISKIELIESFKNKLDSLISSVESLIEDIKNITIDTEAIMTSVETNIDTVKEYKDFDVEKLINFRREIVEKLSEIMAFMQTIQDFFIGWFAENNLRIEEWKNMDLIIDQILLSWQIIPQIFIDFDSNCRTCVVDRGTLLSWLLKIFLGAIDLPIIELPKFPDITVDLSKVSFGLNATIPDFETKEIDMKLFELPDIELPDLSFLEDLNLEVAFESVLEIDFESIFDLALGLDLSALISELNLEELDFPSFDASGNFSGVGMQTLPTLPLLNLPVIPTFPLPALALPQIPKIPAIPLLPKIPDITLTIPFPSLPIPQLPMVPPPPQLPDLLGSLLAVLELPLEFINIFCLLRLGILPVPEWYVKPYVEQLTNRFALSLGLDFGFLSLPKIDFGTKEMKILGSIGFMTALDPLMEIANGLSKTFKNVIDQISTVGNIKIDALSIPSDLGLDIKSNLGLDKLKNIELPTIKSPRKNVLPVPSDIKLNIQSRLFDKLKGISEFKDWYANFKKEIEMSKDKYSDPYDLVLKMQQRARKLVAITPTQKKLKQSILAIKVPSKNNDKLWREDLKRQFAQQIQDFSSVKTKIEKENKVLVKYQDLSVRDFFAQAEIQSIFQKPDRYLAGIEKDSFDNLEITFPQDILKSMVFPSVLKTDGPPDLADNDLLDLSEVNEISTVEDIQPDAPEGVFFKDNSLKMIVKITEFPIGGLSAQALVDLDGDGVEEILFSSNGELYLKNRVQKSLSTTPNYNVKTWSQKEFESIILPAFSVSSERYGERRGIRFERFKEEISYFEWVVADRPDVIFEISQNPDSRSSKIWDRHAFLSQGTLQQYEISPFSAKIISVSGIPKMTRPNFQKIEEVGDCDPRFSEQHFFETQTTVLGIADRSRLEIQVPARRNKPSEYQEMVIRKNEKTFIEYGNICVSNGAIAVITDTEKTEEIIPAEDDFIPIGSSFELAENDKIEIELFDGSNITIFGGERYFLHDFDFNEKFIDDFEFLKSQNLYGFLFGINENGRSAVFSKLLHMLVPTTISEKP